MLLKKVLRFTLYSFKYVSTLTRNQFEWNDVILFANHFFVANEQPIAVNVKIALMTNDLKEIQLACSARTFLYMIWMHLTKSGNYFFWHFDFSDKDLTSKNIFGKFKLSATSSLKWVNEMQYLAITATRSAASRPIWESFCCNMASVPSRLAQYNDAIYTASKR